MPKNTNHKTSRSRRRAATRHSLVAARYLWAVVTGLVIAALLFEPTMVWTLGVGVFMLARLEWLGLWLVVSGYGMACLPVTFGLLVGSGRFWFSLTHGLWTGAVYSVAGFLYLEQILGLLAPYGFYEGAAG
ncbi:hypothetical protein [Nesterenkonia sphaerica]|uniref:Uncharacterized protein n=1 Tax=Nesterenkonia sphaerica TaxID=1804988 RepID=A0A5R9AQ02_9MICC|nr:hypothetical protein [Nesterenkonia sphaerica]TLP79926.1 hypothetical protein FEF27_00640 [Nesterenkonia sphaerica]